MNKIIKFARLEIEQDPNNIIKVAGILSKMKKWVLSLFDSQTKSQIALIDSKYSEIKGTISQLQKDIINIEKAIDEVNLEAYDLAVESFKNTLKDLSEKSQESQEQITQTQQIKNLESVSNDKVKSIFKSSLIETGVQESQIVYTLKNLEALANSIKTSKQILKAFDTEQNVNDFIDKIKEQIKPNILSNILNFKITAVLEPIQKNKESKLKNICILKLKGLLPFSINEKKHNIAIDIYVDVFVNNTTDLEQEAKIGIYKIFKQHVWGIQ